MKRIRVRMNPWRKVRILQDALNTEYANAEKWRQHSIQHLREKLRMEIALRKTDADYLTARNQLRAVHAVAQRLETMFAPEMHGIAESLYDIINNPSSYQKNRVQQTAVRTSTRKGIVEHDSEKDQQIADAETVYRQTDY